MSQKVAIERVDHIGIRVRDLDRALNFYRLLGLGVSPCPPDRWFSCT
jgi:catechol-2,3-dioxygenase